MEKFEDYRKNLADTIKDVPKEERKVILDSEKMTSEYKNAKELHQAKRDNFELIHTETLTDPEDPEDIASWIQSELNDYAENHSAALLGYMLEDFFNIIAEYLASRLKISKKFGNREIVDYSDQTIFRNGDDYDGTTKGNVKLMGLEVLSYSSLGDGYGGSIDQWYNDNLKLASKKLLDYLKK